MIKITERLATEADFVANKDYKPWKAWRKRAKPVNFGEIFGCSGPALGSQLRESFSEADLDEMIGTFSLEDELNNEIFKKKLSGKEYNPIDIKFNIVGTKLRELFFGAYPCLLKRTEREQEFAKEHAYVRAISGPIRELGLLEFCTFNSEGNLCGSDSKVISKIVRGLLNDATNSPIQTAEVYQAMPNVTAMWHMIKILGLKTRVFNVVHDSQELYVHRTEKKLIYGYLHELAIVARNPHFGIPMHIDVTEADPDKGEILGGGIDIDTDEYDFREALKEWNELYGTSWTYEQVDPRQWIPIYEPVVTEKYRGKQYKWVPKTKGRRVAVAED